MRCSTPLHAPVGFLSAHLVPALLFVVWLISSAAGGASATVRATRDDGQGSAPPHLADQSHVANGCHLSTLAYLARFEAFWPNEAAQPIVVTMLNGTGERRPHTVALVTWCGEWWVRDEYFGVFPLGDTVASRPDDAALRRRAETALARHAKSHPTPGADRRAAHSDEMRCVHIAARMLPFRSHEFTVRTDQGELAALLFRPRPGQIAVYIPRHGTCLAECNATDDAQAVTLFATKLGYRVTAVVAGN